MDIIGVSPVDGTMIHTITDLSTAHGHKTLADAIVVALVENDNNCVSTAVKLKRLSKAIDTALSNETVKDHLVRQVRDQKMETMGAVVSHVPVYTEYNFDECNHSGLEAAKLAIKHLAAYMKTVEELLKTINEPVTISIEKFPMIYWIEDGELITVYPAVKSQKMGVKFEKI